MTGWWQLESLANLVVAAAYFCIAALITVPLVRGEQVRSNKLGTATAAIFFSCAVGHGLHSLHAFLAGDGSHGSGHEMGTWWLALWHTLTAVVGVYYLSLRRYYGRLLTAAPLFDDLAEQQRLADLEAFQAEVKARTTAEADRDFFAAMMKSINQNSHSLIFVKDLEGRYLMANEAFEQAVQLSEAELIGHTDDVIAPGLALGWRAADLKAREGRYRVEEVADGPDGLRIYDSVKFPVYDSTGTLYATCGISLDVTDARQASAAVAQARDTALAATAAKSAFLATMSHEIRTPMNAVIGMTDLLLDTDLDEQQHDFVDTVRSSGDALLAVINDILDFSTIESGELRLVTSPFRLRDEVEGSLDLVAATATAKGLDLVCYVDESCPTRVVGDAPHLRQILINLLANAVKFTASGDVLVTVSARPTDAGRLAVTIMVTDTGIGISAAGVAKLFVSFSQVDTSPTRAYGGTGLGLAISRRLTEAMGGEITVESAPGEGSTFTVTVLLDPTDETDEDDRLDEVLPGLSGVSVLIVDDNSTNLRILDLQLSGLEMLSTPVSSPAAALALAAEGQCFDLVLLDLNMPDLNGIELAAALRGLATFTDTPMVLLSSVGARLPETDDMFSAVLAKPVKSAALRAAMATALRTPDDAPSQSRRLPVGRSARPLRILLAEDNPVNQRVAQLMLDKLGHSVDTVPHGAAAVEAVRKKAYDVVLMDIQMPQMDGLEATRSIRAQIPVEQQPHIIAMTASALLADQQACSAAGMESYLTKPVRAQELKAMLGRVSATIRQQPSDPAQERPGVAPADATADRVVDAEALARLQLDLDDDGTLVVELIEKYLSTGHASISNLGAAADAGDGPAAATVAHAMASASALLGAQHLADLLHQAQQVATDAPAQLPDLAALITSEYERAATELRQQADTRGPRSPDDPLD